MAVLKAGFVLVNTNPLYTPRELRHQLRDSGAKVVFCLANIGQALEDVISETGVELVITTEVADLHTTSKRLLVNTVLKYLLRQVPNLRFPHSIRYRQALSAGSQLNMEPSEPKPQRVAVLQYTGGTTGVSKGVMLTHENLMYCMRQLTWVYEKVHWSEGEMRMVMPLPLYHIYAFNVAFVHGLNYGHETLLIPNPRDIRSFVTLLKSTQFDGFAGLNTLFNGLMNDPDFRRVDFSGVKLTISGGMALSKPIADRWQELTGGRICEGYGLTECSGVMSVNDPTEPVLGTVGCVSPGFLLKITDDAGRELGVGEPGELWFKSRSMMTGFWGQPDAMAELVDSDGYMKTGDIARMNDNGYLSIIDRSKDMILVSGFNVYPNEIEDVVIAHPKIAECAVIGGTEGGQEYVRLFLVADPQEISAEEIITYCRQSLAAYKVPRTVTFVDELPKSNVGKILRRELREAYPG